MTKKRASRSRSTMPPTRKPKGAWTASDAAKFLEGCCDIVSSLGFQGTPDGMAAFVDWLESINKELKVRALMVMQAGVEHLIPGKLAEALPEDVLEWYDIVLECNRRHAASLRTEDGDDNPPPRILKGVSLRDVAEVISEADHSEPDEAKIMKRLYRISAKRAIPLGKCVRHSQTNLFSPSTILRVVWNSFGLPDSSYRHVLKELRHKARRVKQA